MDLRFLEESSDTAHQLVSMYDQFKAYDSSKNKDDATNALVEALAVLFEKELSAKECELVADIIIGLMRQAEIDLRAAISERLSVNEAVPLRLVLHIADDDIRVAEPVLTKSPVLNEFDLLYIIKSKGSDYCRSIAKRKSLKPSVVNALCGTQDLETALVLTRNEAITIPSEGMEIMAGMAQQYELLAQSLVDRDELTKEIADKIYAHVGEAIKKDLRMRFSDEELQDVITEVDDVVLEFREIVSPESEAEGFYPTESMLKAAERYRAKGLLNMALMLGTLRRGQITAFIAQFSRYCNLNPSTTIHILSKPEGQGLALACKAIDVNKADYISIYLMTNRMRSDEKGDESAEIVKAVTQYNKVDSKRAKSIFESARGQISEF